MRERCRTIVAGIGAANEMTEKVLNIGIMSRDDYRRRSIAIAGGRAEVGKNDPKVWFESIRSLSDLEKLSHRKKSNLSRTLRTLESCGIVELPRPGGKLAPKVLATNFRLEFSLNH